MHRYSSFLLSMVVAFGLLFATGCDSAGSSGESGTLQLRMDGSSTSKALQTSAKTNHSDVEEALVTIEEVSIVPAEDTSDGDSTEVGVTVLQDDTFEVDLTDLQDGVDTLMTELEIPSDDYSQLRLVTTGPAEVTFADSSTSSIRIASGQQTGLKLNFDAFTIDSADDRVEVTVNWDADHFINGAAQGRSVITPVVDATVNVTSAGN